MLTTPEVVHHPAQLTAVIHLLVPKAEIRTVMGPGLKELMATLQAQEIVPTGPWLTHHLRLAPDVFDFEIAIPVARPVAPSGRVQPGVLRETTVVRAVYSGPYEGLGEAWAQFSTWITDNGHAGAPDVWEQYVAGPESSADPSQWRTEFNRPLADA